MKILGINGIRTTGAKNTDLLLQKMQEREWKTCDTEYPTAWAISARWRWIQRRNAKRIMKYYREGDIVVAHSYGCLLTLRMMEMGARFSHVFFFGAAMNDDFTFPAYGMESLVNVCDVDDRALGIGSILPFHDFGKMGKTGYKGAKDPRVQNVFARDSVTEPLQHSNYFLPENLDTWASFVHFKLVHEFGVSPTHFEQIEIEYD